MKYSLLIGLSLVVATPAFAADPQPAAAVAPAAAATATVTADEARAKLYKQARSRGYKRMTVKGDLMFCRNEATMGSRFEKAVCLNEAALASALKHEADTQADINAGRSGACAGQGCAEGTLGGGM